MPVRAQIGGVNRCLSAKEILAEKSGCLLGLAGSGGSGGDGPKTTSRAATGQKMPDGRTGIASHPADRRNRYIVWPRGR